MGMSRGLWLVLLICAAGGLWHLAHREPGAVRQSPGTVAPHAPTQTMLENAATISFGRFTLTPLAEFRTEARVLSRKNYGSDAESELSPLDFALGWGRMSDNAVLEQLNISQGVRFFNYRWENQPPIPPQEIVVSATNVHLIPEDAGVLHALEKVRAGQVVRLEGVLVAAERGDGWRWRSSLTREDDGAGACELLLVRKVAVVNAGG